MKRLVKNFNLLPDTVEAFCNCSACATKCNAACVGGTTQILKNTGIAYKSNYGNNITNVTVWN